MQMSQKSQGDTSLTTRKTEVEGLYYLYSEKKGTDQLQKLRLSVFKDYSKTYRVLKFTTFTVC